MPWRGSPKSAAAPLAHCPTGPFGRPQTPQNGVRATTGIVAIPQALGLGVVSRACAGGEPGLIHFDL